MANSRQDIVNIRKLRNNLKCANILSSIVRVRLHKSSYDIEIYEIQYMETELSYKVYELDAYMYFFFFFFFFFFFLN